jgi:hypothetical protein
LGQTGLALLINRRKMTAKLQMQRVLRVVVGGPEALAVMSLLGMFVLLAVLARCADV